MLKRYGIFIIFGFLLTKPGFTQGDLDFRLVDFWKHKKPNFTLPLVPQPGEFITLSTNSAGSGGAYAGYLNNPTAIYLNPAALTALDGRKVYLEAGYRSEFDLSVGESQDALIFPQALSGAVSLGSFSIGLGYFCPYYMNTLTNQSETDENSNSLNQQRKIDVISLATAYDFKDKLALGIAIFFLNDTWKAKENGFTLFDSQAKGLNIAVGSLVRIVRGIDFGINYMKKSDLIDTEKWSDPLIQVEVKHLLPARLRMGTTVSLSQNWQILFDAEKIFWSEIPSLFYTLNNRFQYYLGINKKFSNRSFRLGFYTRSHPVSEKLDQKLLTLGFEQKVKKAVISISFQDSHLLTSDKDYLSDLYSIKSVRVSYFLLGVSYNI